MNDGGREEGKGHRRHRRCPSRRQICWRACCCACVRVCVLVCVCVRGAVAQRMIGGSLPLSCFLPSPPLAYSFPASSCLVTGVPLVRSLMAHSTALRKPSGCGSGFRTSPVGRRYAGKSAPSCGVRLRALLYGPILFPPSLPASPPSLPSSVSFTAFLVITQKAGEAAVARPEVRWRGVWPPEAHPTTAAS